MLNKHGRKMHMRRKEASIEEWRELYDCTTTLREIEPWNDFWDVELVSLQFSEDEEPIFISILGRGGNCFGISCYLGLAGLNDFIMLVQQDELGLTPEYVMFSQNNLTCYWGNRDELSTQQYEIIKQLGYKYRGNSNWLYFHSFKAGYYPYNLDKEEVLQLTKYFVKLIEAINYYRENSIAVDFEHKEAYSFYFDEADNEWRGKAMKLPITDYSFSGLKLTDSQLIKKLGSAKRSSKVLEVDLVYLGVTVNDKKYNRPANPHMYLVADNKKGMMLKFQMIQPDEDAGVELVGDIIGYIFEYGAPSKIMVRSHIVATIIEDICEICKIKVERHRNLDVTDNFLYEFKMLQAKED